MSKYDLSENYIRPNNYKLPIDKRLDAIAMILACGIIRHKSQKADNKCNLADSQIEREGLALLEKKCVITSKRVLNYEKG